MLLIAVISNTVALLPIGFVLLIAPIAFAVIAHLVAKGNSNGKLTSMQKSILSVCLLADGWAIGCATYIGRDYFHEALRSIYVVIGLLIVIVCLVNVMISSESS